MAILNNTDLTSNTLIEDVDITAAGTASNSAAIHMRLGPDNTTIQRVNIMNVDEDGILADGGPTNVLITDVTIDGGALRGDDGIAILQESDNVTIGPNVNLSNVADRGIHVSGLPGTATNTTISGVTITDAGTSSILVIDSENTLIEDATLTNLSMGMSQTAIGLTVGSDMTIIRRVDISNIDRQGIFMSGGPTKLTTQQTKEFSSKLTLTMPTISVLWTFGTTESPTLPPKPCATMPSSTA